MVDLTAHFSGLAVNEPGTSLRLRDLADPSPIVIRDAGREGLPALFKRLGYQSGAEIGVLYGEYSELLCQGIPNLHLTCVDRWAPYKSGRTGKTIFHRAVKAYDLAKERLQPYGCTLCKGDSVEVAKTIADGVLDFVYLDANHWFESVVADLAAWIPKVKRGGCIAGHDYEEDLEEDNCVKLAVTSWTRAHHIHPWFVLGRPKVRRGEHRDEHRTWLWFKE
jgi:predicted O-methyltransferase YrrM